MKLYAAIDPGLTGAIAIVDDKGGYIGHAHMPTAVVGTSKEVNVPAVVQFLSNRYISHCFIEKVQGMNKGGVKQAASAAFKFGDAYGSVKGCVGALFIPTTYITPQVWKRHAGILGKEKDASRGRCLQLYPGIPDLNLKGKGQALADALLIARFGLGLK